MTENEELQKNAAQSRAVQQVEEISAYLDSLSGNIDMARARHRDSNIIYFVVWVCWVVSGFISREWDSLFTIFFVGGLAYDSYRFAKLLRAYGEFAGALKILEILGMIPPHGGGRERKKRQVWNEGVDMVKGWFKTKEKAQEVYAPA